MSSWFWSIVCTGVGPCPSPGGWLFELRLFEFRSIFLRGANYWWLLSISEFSTSCLWLLLVSISFMWPKPPEVSSDLPLRDESWAGLPFLVDVFASDKIWLSKSLSSVCAMGLLRVKDGAASTVIEALIWFKKSLSLTLCSATIFDWARCMRRSSWLLPACWIMEADGAAVELASLWCLTYRSEATPTTSFKTCLL